MLNPMDLTGRTVLVTGASSGLGRAICVLVSRLGGRVVLVARNSDRLSETLSLMDAGEHRLEPFDLHDLDTIPEWMKQLCSEAGPLDGLVHSAGLHATLPVRVLKPSRLDELMKINFSAAVALTKGFRQRGVRAEQSSVVYLASVAALTGASGNAPYSASKGALVSMCRSLAMELAAEQIRVNCVAPGHVPTAMAAKVEQVLDESHIKAIEDMHPLGLGRPDDVASAVAFLLADSGRWITGTTLVVDGGYTAH
jgi:NAD(P)-dependent dehydrogenase (short-subunit alcohol dehydrogenase family)